MKNTFIILTVGLAVLGSSCHKNTPESPTVSPKDFYQELKSVDKMVFSNMAVTKTAKLTDDDWYKVGNRGAVYSYDSYLRAYIDLSELQIDDIVVDEDAKTVKIVLPPIKTEVIGRDMDMRKEYDNVGTFRKAITAQERAQIKELANKSFKNEVEENPEFRQQLKDAAQKKARMYFGAIFEREGYTPSIDFKESN